MISSKKSIFFLNNPLEHAESIIFKKLKTSVQIVPLRIKNQLKSAESLAKFVGVYLRRGKGFRRIISAVSKIKQKCPGLEGFRVSCAGRIRGVEMAKTMTQGLGKTPTGVFSKKVDFFSTQVITKHGVIGIKAWICFS
jgi:small subunit ribosomal protein S3